MASEKKLDCVILGLLSHEELTGYEIKRRMDTTLRYFWGASYGSIYPTLGQLVDRGLALRRPAEDSARRKQIYSITDSGREYLKKWLQTPAERDEIRYETLLKLFFGSESGPGQAEAHIEAFARRIAAEMPYLLGARKALLDSIDEEASHRYYLLTVEFGIKTYSAYLEWCGQAKAILKGE